MADLHDRHVYLLTEDERQLVQGGPALVAPDGTRHDVPTRVYEALREVEETLRSGKAVQIRTFEQEVSISEAADLINMHRDTLRAYLEDGTIPHRKQGTIPWMRLTDVLAFDRRLVQQREEALQEMANEPRWDESTDDTSR